MLSRYLLYDSSLVDGRLSHAWYAGLSRIIRSLTAPSRLSQFIAGTTVGLTPLAPVGILATLLVRSQKPIWKPYGQKRFAWAIGVVMVTTCLVFVLSSSPDLPGRRYYMMGMASICVVLTYLESAVGE